MKLMQLGESKEALLLHEGEVVAVVHDWAEFLVPVIPQHRRFNIDMWNGDYYKDGLADYYNRLIKVEAES